MDKHYLVYKKTSNTYCYINYKDLDGYTFIPQNDDGYYGIKVSKMYLINKHLITDVLKRKVKNKLNLYLNLILSMYDEDDEWNNPSTLGAALNEVERFKSIVKNKYRKYLEEKYVSILLAKLSLIEKELKDRINYLVFRMSEELEEKENRRSR